MGPNQVSIYFSLSALALLILSGITAVFLKNAAIDITIHDTYLVIAHYHILILISVFFGIWALAYYTTPKLLRINLNKTWSQIHFWSTIIGFLILVISIQSEKMSMSPRRYYSFDSYRQFYLINIIITTVAILLLVSQLIYFFNVIYGLMKKRN